MAESLLTIVERRFATGVDPDSDGGRILGALTPGAPFDDQALTGEADAAPLTLVPTQSGVTVRAAAPADPLVLSLPAGPLEFTIVPPVDGSPPQVEIKLLGLVVPVPSLRPAQVTAGGTLGENTGQVHFHLPDLLLVVTATAAPSAAAHLAQGTGPGGSREVTMTPPAALVGPGTVVGFAFQTASLSLDSPTGPEITVPELELYVAPPGIAALAIHGGGHDLRFGMSPGDGLDGDFQLALASGASAVARPRFLEDLAAHLRLDRGAVTQLELTGRIDIGGEVAARLGPLGDGADKVSYTLGLTLDSGWRASLALTAGGQDAYLWRTQRPEPSTHDLLRDTLGAYAVFTPLLASNLPVGDGYLDLALGPGAAAGLAASQAVG
nr:hypothetical protein [Rubrobacteraceae bacterium]